MSGLQFTNDGGGDEPVVKVVNGSGDGKQQKQPQQTAAAAAPTSSANLLTVPNGGRGATVTIGGDRDDDDFDPNAADENGVTMELELELEEDRDQWSNPLQFFFTILGFCVGLGNIWRFPYLCQANGGGAFVIPFLIMIVIEGAPLLLLELAIGQRLRKGSYLSWNMIHPLLGGIGIGSTIIGTVIGCYYNVIIAWCLYYLVMSIRPTLPWTDCPTIDPPEPSSDSAVSDADASSNVTAADNMTYVHLTQHHVPNLVPECEMSSETQYFWYRQALDISEDIEDPEGLKWWMWLSLTIAWIVVYLVVRKGIQSSGKVVYFTALFPYVVLTIFFIRGLTLKGATAGIAHMFTPDIDKLLSPTVWLEAANQVFYSFSLAFGSIVGFGSYNPMDKNCVYDTIAISISNAFTALYAGAVVFSILGFKAQHLFEKCMEHDLDLISDFDPNRPAYNASDMDEAQYTSILHSYQNEVSGLKNCTLADELNKAAQGTGLAFVVMTDVFTMLPGAPFWSFLFFSMLLSLGLGSQIGILEGVMGTFFDMPQFKNQRKTVVSGLCCIFCYLVGHIFVTGAGEYWLTVVDKYVGIGLSVIAFCEIMSVMYVYGHARFTEDIYQMTGVRPGLYWQITWRFVAPILIAVILVSSIVSETMKKPVYGAWKESEASSEDTEYPSWCLAIAVILALGSFIPMVVIGGLRAMKINVLPVDVETLSKAAGATLRRVATDASTRPMMHVESYHDMPADRNQQQPQQQQQQQQQ